MRAEFRRNEINAKFGSNFKMAVVYYCQFILVSCRRNARNKVMEGQFIKSMNLEEIAAK